MHVELGPYLLYGFLLPLKASLPSSLFDIFLRRAACSHSFLFAIMRKIWYSVGEENV